MVIYQGNRQLRGRWPPSRCTRNTQENKHRPGGWASSRRIRILQEDEHPPRGYALPKRALCLSLRLRLNRLLHEFNFRIFLQNDNNSFIRTHSSNSIFMISRGWSDSFEIFFRIWYHYKILQIFEKFYSHYFSCFSFHFLW